MANIGVIGLGKLGLPVAVAMNSKGHKVTGYDIMSNPGEYLRKRKIPYQEAELQPLLDTHTINIAESIEEVVAASELVFLAVQTPHDPRFEGSERIPEDRKDFDYKYLLDAIQRVSAAVSEIEKPIHLVVISTCLPGTYEKWIAPFVEENELITYHYNPFFIAMGTVLKDFLDPEFVLLGSKGDNSFVKDFYSTIHDRPFMETDITTAEGIKVFYNTFITMKTVLANTYGEMAHKIGMNVDDIYKALSMATDRIVSPKYLKAGLGDGGGCHPRDNIALSHIAKEVGLSHNIFEDLMAAREDHAEWLANLVVKEAKKAGLPLVMLGRSFKPETNIETGSPAVLIANIIREQEFPVEHVEDRENLEPAVYFIGCEHSRYKNYEFPEGSVVIDPFRFLPKRENVSYVSIGKPDTINSIRAQV